MGWGDELMAAGDARRLMDEHGKRVAIIDRDGCHRWHGLWEGNPAIARPGEQGKFRRMVNGPGARPYHTAKTDTRWHYNLAYRATPAELFFTDAERSFGERGRGLVIVEPHIKGKASPNKQWGWVRWNKLAWILAGRGYRIGQVGPQGTKTLERVDLISTSSFREACGVLAHALAAVLPEGGLHHAAAAVGLPAVVIFGGFTPVEITGYDLHRNIGASGKDACGSRQPCEHCANWMASIAPETVADELEALLEHRNKGMVGAVAACA